MQSDRERGPERAERQLAAERRVLDLIAGGAPLDATLEAIASMVEAELPGVPCSILLVDDTGARLSVAAAASLPPAYNRAVEGLPVREGAGACGTAAARRELVVVEDIATDPLWRDYRDETLPHGLRACTSLPLLSPRGAVLGTLALYYRAPRRAPEAHLELARVAGSLASIAIEGRSADARKREAVERFELISRATNDVVWDWDLASDTLWWNDAYHERFGHPRERTARGPESRTDFIHPEDRAATAGSIRAVIDGGGSAWQAEYRFRRADGEYRFVMDRGFVVRDPFGQAVRMLGAMVDITERRRAEEKLAQLAQYDALTGLPNRALFRDRLELAVARARRERSLMALAFIDLDRFKEVNDTLGHAAGDAMLRAVAQRLRGCLRESDTVARLAGDEFTVILEDVRSATDVPLIAQKVMAALEQPVEHEGREFAVTASLGFALFPDDGEDAETLLRHADAAMYQGKSDGRNTFQRFAAEMREAARGRATLEAGLRRALERGELELHYQSIYRLEGRRLVGAEALLRWRHPERGLVPPGEFIGVAEASDLIVPIGAWVVREACRQAARWRAAGAPGLHMAVNASARQFRRPGLVETVREALAESGLEGGALTLEITESLLMDNPDGSRKVLEGLKALGVKVALDDFGTGFSSLAYLRRFPIDSVKIDRSFVGELPGSAEDATIVRAVIGLARDLRLGVTAEGIEGQPHLDFLLAHGCDFGQGYLFGRPEATADFEKRLATSGLAGRAPPR